MNDETKAALRRFAEYCRKFSHGEARVYERNAEDIEAALAHIDGEPLRQAKALEAVRDENTRLLRELENDAARLAAAREEAIMEWRAGAADRDELRADCERRIAAAADELRTLRERVAELEAALLDSCREKVLHGHTTTLLTNSLRLKVPGVENYESWGEERRSRLQQAEAQVAAARAECARLVDRPWSRWAGDAGRDVLRAMDEATKK